jgi:hypothetical protein
MLVFLLRTSKMTQLRHRRRVTFYGGDSNPQNADYEHSFCRVHVTQYQKNEGIDTNPLHDCQMAITIKDGKINQIGYATKQDAEYALIVDSRLPIGLIIQDGLVDNDPVCFWYSNQWWCSNDQLHHCNFGIMTAAREREIAATHAPFLPIPATGQQPNQSPQMRLLLSP